MVRTRAGAPTAAVLPDGGCATLLDKSSALLMWFEALPDLIYRVDFAVGYACAGALWLAGVHSLRNAAASLMDRFSLPALPPGAPAAAALPAAPAALADPADLAGSADPAVCAPYRVAATVAPRQPLRAGSPPEAEDAFAIAYLRGGTADVANALLARALAAGWLVPHPRHQHTFTCQAPATPPEDPLAAAFTRYLAPLHLGPRELPVEVLSRSALDAAQRHAPVLRAQLQDAALLRTPGERRVLGWLAWVLGAPAAALGSTLALFIPAAPSAPLLLASLLVWGALWRVAQAPAPNALRARYLTWLERSTAELRQQVRDGHDRAPEDVALAVATSGAAALMGGTWLGGLSSMLLRPGALPAPDPLELEASGALPPPEPPEAVID